MQRLPYAQRMRNRAIAITVLVTLIVAIVHCSTTEDIQNSTEAIAKTEIPDSTAGEISIQSASSDTSIFDDTTVIANPNGLARLTGIEDDNFASDSTYNDTDVKGRDTTHIKSQKNAYLADKIDILLRRYHPDLGIILVVDTKTNEIIAWGERRDGKVQNRPDWIGRATFPAASLAKLVTISAAMESNR